VHHSGFQGYWVLQLLVQVPRLLAALQQVVHHLLLVVWQVGLCLWVVLEVCLHLEVLIVLLLEGVL
jgi:hypothetical protein